MPYPKTPWRVAADELLSDGEWHDRSEIISVMTRMVPPSRAIRVRRMQVERLRQQRGYTKTEIDVSLDHEVSVGALAVANKCLRYALTDSTWEHDGDRVRLAPKEKGTC